MNFFKTKKFWITLVILSILLLSPIIYYVGLVFVFTPANIREPEAVHFHFRMQLVVESEYQDFSQKKFQESYTPGVCSAELTESPIHFHDGKDQLVHIHWADVTGGQVLKYYGLNRVGGLDNTMGYRVDGDNRQNPKRVPIHGQVIKESKEKMHVYLVQKEDYKLVEADDFLNNSLEDFFTNDLEEANSGWNIGNIFAVSAYAHSEDKEEDSEPTEDEKSQEYTEEELREINDLIGDVLIFVQEKEPSDEEIQARLDNWVELEATQCGG